MQGSDPKLLDSASSGGGSRLSLISGMRRTLTGNRDYSAYGAGLQRRVLEHDKGHVVPQRAGDMAAIADFLRYVQSLQPQRDAADAD